MKKFEHGGDIDSFAKKLKCKKEQILDLSSNINFLKPKIDLDLYSLNIQSYPNYDKVYEIIAKHYKIKKINLELYNGASSAIFTLFRNLNLKHCTIYSPAYLEYKKAAKCFGYKIEHINRFEDIYKQVKENSLVVFVNPSTPDGLFYDINRLFKTWVEKNCTIIIDESFLEFTKNPSAIPYIEYYEKLYIIKSLTKLYSCAGVRVGAVISNKKSIKRLKHKEAKWKLSTYDINYIIEALKDKGFIHKTLEQTDENRELLMKLLIKYPFIKSISNSCVNFLLVELKTLEAKELQKLLKKDKIMIRDCSNFDFLNSSFIRVAIKSKKAISTLKKALDRI